ncbi:hypothetical protein JCM18750_09690 [Halostagnicola bangensis]
MSTGAPPSKSYSWCYKMATVSIVGQEVKFTLGMRPLRGYIPRRVLVEQLLEIEGENVLVGTVYTDAEFNRVGVMHAVEEAGSPIPSGNRRIIRSNGLCGAWTTTSG